LIVKKKYTAQETINFKSWKNPYGHIVHYKKFGLGKKIKTINKNFIKNSEQRSFQNKTQTIFVFNLFLYFKKVLYEKVKEIFVCLINLKKNQIYSFLYCSRDDITLSGFEVFLKDIIFTRKGACLLPRVDSYFLEQSSKKFEEKNFPRPEFLRKSSEQISLP